jgi:hypothetical protein
VKKALWWAVPALLGAVVGGLIARRGVAPTPPSLVADDRIVVRSGSRLLRDGQLAPGGPAVASAARERAQRRARETLALIPVDLRPTRLLLDLEPGREPGVTAVDGLEYHQGSGSLLLGAAGITAGNELWLHEAAHVRMAGARPRGPLAGRLIGAIEEGFADYFAAALSGQTKLGAAPRQRDLQAPPRIGESEWASLAFDGFDRHRMGWALAARLYQLDANGGSLLRDVVACLDGDSELGSADDSPVAVIAALLSACPEPGRPRLARVLWDWLPRELTSNEIPT